MKPNILYVTMPTVPIGDIRACFTGDNVFYQTLVMPLGVMYVSSYTKQNCEIGRVKLLDYALNLQRGREFSGLEEFIRGLALKTAGFTPDIVAFSLNLSVASGFFELCAAGLKTIWPQAVTVAGGTHATNAVNYILKNEIVDFVIRGEGERGMADFINTFSGKESISGKGIYSKQNVGHGTRLEITDFIMDLDEIPFPDWELIDMDAYATSKGRRKKIGDADEARIASMFTTRGCPYKCTFCSSHTVHGRRVRYRSTENIVQEMKTLHERYKVNLFIPEDDLFTAKRSRFLELLSAIKELDIPGLELQLPDALRVKDLDEKMIDALVSAGQKVVVLAIESGSERTQKMINKNVNLKKAVEIVKRFKERGCVVRCYFILGFPGETREMMEETVEYTRNLGADWCNFIIATPLAGSEMYAQFVEMGAIPEDFHSHADLTFAERQFDTPEISAADLNEFAYRSNLDVNFINNHNKTSGQYEKAISLYRDIVDSYPFHIIAWYCIMDCWRLMGRGGEAARAREKINTLLNSDPRAKSMFEKYGDLMPDFKPT